MFVVRSQHLRRARVPTTVYVRTCLYTHTPLYALIVGVVVYTRCRVIESMRY